MNSTGEDLNPGTKHSTFSYDLKYGKRYDLGPNPLAQLVRGEKNYFPEGTLRSLNLHTPSMLRRPNYLRHLQPSQLSQSGTDAEANFLRKKTYNSRRTIERVQFQRTNAASPQQHDQSDHYYQIKRAVATAGASVAKSTDLGPVVQRKTAHGSINFHLNTEKWLGISDIDREIASLGTEREEIDRGKGNKGVTRERSPSREEQKYSTKEHADSDSRYFTQDLGSTRLDLSEGNNRAERRSSVVIRTKQYIQLSDDSGFSLQTTIKPTNCQMMSNCSTPCQDGMISTEPSSVGFTKEMTGISEQLTLDEPNPDHFKVFLRIRPLDDPTTDSNSTRPRSLSVENQTQVLLCTRPSKGKESNGTKYLFTYAHVFAEGTPQREVFETTTQSLVDAVLIGNQTCVISYGIPNSGKSYTLYGKATSGKHRGVIMRSMESLFNTVNGNKDPNDPSASDGIKLTESGNITNLDGATQVTVTTVDEISKQLRRSPNRSKYTITNEVSWIEFNVHLSLHPVRDAGSRSHTVYTVKLVKEEVITPSSDETGGSKEQTKITEGELRFVDLVGVERSVKHALYDSPAVGTAEAKTAKSLHLFANMVLSQAGDNSAVTSYRDSKLTRLLRNALGGDCITRFIVTATPDPNLAHETLSSLQFAQKACQITNYPTTRVTVQKCDKEETEPSHCKQPEQIPRKIGAQNYKLPPILSNSSHRLNFNPDETFSRSQDYENPTTSSNHGTIYSEVGGPTDLSAANTSTTSGVFSYPADEREQLSPDGIIYVQERPENANKVVPLPSLNSSGTGQIFPHRSTNGYKVSENLQRAPGKKSPTNDSVRRTSGKRNAEKPGRFSSEPSTPRTRSQESVIEQTRHSDTLRMADRTDFLHGSNEIIGLRKTPSPAITPKTEYPMDSSRPASSVITEDERVCCAECKVREAKIKADYDRMIIFSKKDRDDKQNKIEELQREMKRVKAESVSLSQIKSMEEQRAQDKIAADLQSREIARLETQLESLKVKLGGMVSSTEIGAMQELRRKEHNIVESLKMEIESLKLKAKEEAEKHKKEIMAKNDTIRRLERECNSLKKDSVNKEKVILENKKRHEERIANNSVELQRTESRHETIVAELNAKIMSCTREISKMRDWDVKSTKDHQEEKENLERELALARATATNAQADLKIAQGKLVSVEREQRLTRPVGQNGSHSQMSSRSSLARSMDLKDAGTGMSNSPDSEAEGSCVACGRHLTRLEMSSDIARDEELRILLLQDARNREVLIQLKRERNLLCDVMKIMYCRQWFIEEALPHIKRTLRRVGVDTKSLNTLRKKF